MWLLCLSPYLIRIKMAGTFSCQHCFPKLNHSRFCSALYAKWRKYGMLQFNWDYAWLAELCFSDMRTVADYHGGISVIWGL